VGPDRWEARLPAAPPGTLVSVRALSATGGESRTIAVVPVAAEELVRGVNDARIRALARSADRPPGEIPGLPPPRRIPRRDPWHLPFLIVALALLPVDVAVRRIRR
jgi:hypothetical protein